MKKSTLLVVALVVLVLALSTGPDLWAAPGQSLERQTVPTRTPVPPPTEPPPPPETSSDDSEPAPAGPSLAQLEESLNAAWASADWQRVIDIINQMLTMDPNYGDLVDKLYAAHVAKGRQLLEGGDTDGAVAQFNRALEIKPDGQEALAGLQQATAGKSPASTSAASGETVVAARPPKALLPDAGGASAHAYLGAAMALVGFLILMMVRRR